MKRIIARAIIRHRMTQNDGTIYRVEFIGLFGPGVAYIELDKMGRLRKDEDHRDEWLEFADDDVYDGLTKLNILDTWEVDEIRNELGDDVKKVWRVEEGKTQQ